MSDNHTSDIAPIARLAVDEEGRVTGAILYAPGLPPGEHDVYPVPMGAAAERLEGKW
jgi:hypothetical protein